MPEVVPFIRLVAVVWDRPLFLCVARALYSASLKEGGASFKAWRWCFEVRVVAALGGGSG